MPLAWPLAAPGQRHGKCVHARGRVQVQANKKDHSFGLALPGCICTLRGSSRAGCSQASRAGTPFDPGGTPCSDRAPQKPASLSRSAARCSLPRTPAKQRTSGAFASPARALRARRSLGLQKRGSRQAASECITKQVRPEKLNCTGAASVHRVAPPCNAEAPTLVRLVECQAAQCFCSTEGRRLPAAPRAAVRLGTCCTRRPRLSPGSRAALSLGLPAACDPCTGRACRAGACDSPGSGSASPGHAHWQGAGAAGCLPLRRSVVHGRCVRARQTG